MFGSVLIILTFAVRYKKYIYTHFWIFYFFLLLMAGTINVISPPILSEKGTRNAEK